MFDVITFGSATRDIFLKSDLFRVVHDPKHLERLGFPTGEAQCFALGSKIEIKDQFETLGGGAANAAVTFARQGFKVGTFAKVGNDRNGLAAALDLKAERITSFFARDKKFATSYSVILVSPNGERTILDYRGASQYFKKNEVQFNKLSARWAYISPGHLDLSLVREVVEHLHSRGTKITINPSQFYLKMGIGKLAPLLKKIDVVMMNREEAAYLLGIKYEEERKIFKKFDELIKGIAVMTDGPRGVLVSDGKKVYRAGTFKEKKILDRTGAGDAFGSGFTAALARRSEISYASIHEAIRLGSANATSVVEVVGATPGILTRREFGSAPRWHHLPIMITKI